MVETWRYFLGLADDMSVIGEMRHATSRTLSLAMNAPGSAGCGLSTRDPLAARAIPWETCLIAQRGDEIKWSGPIQTRALDGASRRVTISAKGWFEELVYRYLRDLLGMTDDAANVILALLAYANSQGKTLITPGTIITSQQRTVSYPLDANIAREIQNLAALESGVDFEVDPSTRKLNVFARIGQNRPDCKWLFIDDVETDQDQDQPQASGQGNLKNVTDLLDGQTIVNDQMVRGQTSSETADDPDSIYRFRVKQAVASLSDVVDIDILNAFANAEIVYRKNPRQTWQIYPKSAAVEGMPRIFDDYNLGDTNYLTARFGGDPDLDIGPDQAIRIFGADLTIDDKTSLETVTTIKTAADQ